MTDRMAGPQAAYRRGYDMAEMKPGERLRCASCGTQAVVIKPDGPVPHCCGQEMENSSAAARS
jgi:hypothetical protein